MQVVLVMFRAEGDKRSFSVTRDVTIIGRREDCDLRIPVSEVSRKHCRIIRDGDTVRAEDLGSSNGTFHNGQRISGSAEIAPGDSVQVGPVVFVLQIDGNPPEDELTPFKDRAAHHLNDELAEHPPMELAHDSEEAADNLEILEETPSDELATVDSEEIPESEFLPMADHHSSIALTEDSEPLSFDLTDDHEHATHGDHHNALSDDELLLDINTVEDAHKEH